MKNWYKPAKGDFPIYYALDYKYVPEFAADISEACYMLEPKASSKVEDSTVLAKACGVSEPCSMLAESPDTFC